MSGTDVQEQEREEDVEPKDCPKGRFSQLSNRGLGNI